jgi:alpha-L-arabinofuranosidase
MLGALLSSGSPVHAQAPLPLYTDHLVNAFQNWSWGTLNLANTSPVHTGADSISLSGTAWNVALSLEHPDFDTSPYASLVFWANGGPGGGQVLQAYAQVGTNSLPAVQLGALSTTWQAFIVPLSALGAAHVTNLNRLTLQLTSYGTTATFYIDDVELTAAAAPALVHLRINADQPLRAVDSRWFGVNTAVWDNNFDTSATVALLREMGSTILRFPGGSLSDDYHWASNTSDSNTWHWATGFPNFVHVATNVGAQAFVTVNYGTGTPDEAAAWVRSSNLTNHYGFKYWEIGNEVYGTWETDTNIPPNDGYTYATRSAAYLQQMKAVDPTIKIGIVVTPGEDSSVNGNTTHPATNLLTGEIHYGWTPVLLSTLRRLGVTPDFAVYHRYPEYTSAGQVNGSDSDPLLLQSSTGWAVDAADLRAQISGYFGPRGTNIELVCTENNSDAGAQGRQSTSLVNGLYYADSLAHVMQTEFNAFVWWDLRNGTDASGTFDPTLYGWRTNGDLGMIGGLATRYPPFYAAKLMRIFAGPGDTILGASSDYLLLSAYAARHANGSLSVLVLNKDTSSSFNAQLDLTGFSPSPSVAEIKSYGIPQDETTRTNGPAAGQDIATSTFQGASDSFDYTFPPLSMTLFTLAPTAPSLSLLPPASPGGPVILQLRGEPGVYVLQSTTNLTAWTDISTNTLSGATLNLTNPIPTTVPVQFWRAVWP